MKKQLILVSLFLTTTLQCSDHTSAPVTFEQIRKQKDQIKQSMQSLQHAKKGTPFESPVTISYYMGQLAQMDQLTSSAEAGEALAAVSALCIMESLANPLLEAADLVEKLELENESLKRQLASKRQESKRGGPAAAPAQHEALTDENASLKKELAALQEKIAKVEGALGEII